MIGQRFSTRILPSVAMLTSLIGFLQAEPIPALPVMMKDIEKTYYQRSSELVKTSRDLESKLKKAGKNPQPSLLKQWQDFQVTAKQEQIELQAMQEFMFSNSESKKSKHVPVDKNYQKLHRYQFLENTLRVGDFWVKEGLNQYSDKAAIRVSWEKAKISYQKEKQQLEKDDFVKSGGDSWEAKKTEDKGLSVIEAKGRALKRALKKSQGKADSILDRSKDWKELTPEEKAKVIVSQ